MGNQGFNGHVILMLKKKKVTLAILSNQLRAPRLPRFLFSFNWPFGVWTLFFSITKEEYVWCIKLGIWLHVYFE